MKKAEIKKAKQRIEKAAAKLAARPWDTLDLREALEATNRMYGEWIDEDERRLNNDEAALFSSSLIDWLDGYIDQNEETTRQAISDGLGIVWHLENN